MSETDFALPEAYRDLAWLADWALPTERGRHSKRIGTPLPEIQRVYDALLPRIEAMNAAPAPVPVHARPPGQADRHPLPAVCV